VNKFVLDTSALLALLNEEPGIDQLPSELELVSGAVMSTVNLAEAQGKLVEKGASPEEAWEAIVAPIRQSFALNEEQAKLVGTLLPQTRSLGLSLGDRACLALAITLNAPVYTSDRQWGKLDIGVPIHVIR
jgi:ribonuclease VapC